MIKLVCRGRPSQRDHLENIAFARTILANEHIDPAEWQLQLANRFVVLDFEFSNHGVCKFV